MTDRFWDRRGGGDDEQKEKAEGVRIIGADEAAEALERGDAAPRIAEGAPRFGDRPAPPPDDARPVVRFPLPAEASDDLTRPRPVTPAMPHWTEPPTGEVPRVLADESAQDEDDFAAWSSFAGAAPRWRDQAGDWQEPDFDRDDLAPDAGATVGALDETDRPRPGEFFAGLDDGEALAEVPRRPPRPAAPRARPSRADRPASSSRDMQLATITGVGLVLGALALFSIGPGAAMVLVLAILVLAAAELFAALQRGGYQPATLLGLVATGGLAAGAYWRGEAAVPLVLSLAVVTTLLWFLVGVPTQHPTMNAGVTLLAIGQVGVLGSFAALILTMPNGIGVLIGVVVAVVANDVGALLVGQQVGKSPVAREISPNKTVEGVVGGSVASILASVLLLAMLFELTPWDTGSALALGVVVAVVAPLGDLCESMLKRDLGVKDMGSLLPGHGGIYDRFDALLFALPAAYYLCRVLDIA